MNAISDKSHQAMLVDDGKTCAVGLSELDGEDEPLLHETISPATSSSLKQR